VNYDPATKKETLNPEASYMVTVEGESDAKDDAANPLAEDKRWYFAAAQSPDSNEEDQ